METEIHIGTAGWSYEDWIGNFYPSAQKKGLDWLEFYSGYFDCVEVNASYYTYLGPRVVESWLRKVEAKNEFLFTYKLHQDFTHRRSYASENVAAVKYNLGLLERNGRLGGLLVQFPYSFQFNEISAAHLSRIKEDFQGTDCFVEVRHSSWNCSEAEDMMKQLGCTLCTIDQPGIGKSVVFNPVAAGDLAYIRFHGRNSDAWARSLASFGKEQTYEQQSSRYKYFYSPGELMEIDRKIREMFDKVRKVFVIMNNHPAGYAVANAFELLYLLKGKNKVAVPETVVKSFPRLEKIAIPGSTAVDRSKNDRAIQGNLF